MRRVPEADRCSYAACERQARTDRDDAGWQWCDGHSVVAHLEEVGSVAHPNGGPLVRHPDDPPHTHIPQAERSRLRRERIDKATGLTAIGWGPEQIAVELGVHPLTVTRYLRAAS